MIDNYSCLSKYMIDFEFNFDYLFEHLISISISSLQQIIVHEYDLNYCFQGNG